MPAKLKVFRAQMGFFESVVAAPSQKAALDAWGVRQNLFGEGLAKVADDPEAIKAALAAPGQPLRRPAGSDGGFERADAPATRLPRPPKTKAPLKAKAKESRPPEPSRPKPSPPPSRADLDAAERAVRDLETEHRAAMEEIARARRELDTRADAADLDFKQKSRAAGRALGRASTAYEKALARARRP